MNSDLCSYASRCSREGRSWVTMCATEEKYRASSGTEQRPKDAVPSAQWRVTVGGRPSRSGTSMCNSPGVGKSTVGKIKVGKWVLIQRTRGRMTQDVREAGARSVSQWILNTKYPEWLLPSAVCLSEQGWSVITAGVNPSPPCPVMDRL